MNRKASSTSKQRTCLLMDADKAPIGDDPSSRLDFIIVEYGTQIPTQILAAMFELTNGAINKRRRKLKRILSKDASRALYHKFIRLEQPPQFERMTLAENGELRVLWRRLRHDWDERSSSGSFDRIDEVVREYSSIFPREAIARALDTTGTIIGNRQRALGCSLSKSEALKLRCRFRKQNLGVVEGSLTALELRKVIAYRRELRNEADAAHEKAQQASRKRAQELLEKQRKARAAFLADRSSTRLYRCSGTCDEKWPRNEKFFPKSKRTRSGFITRCKACVYLWRQEDRLRSENRPKRKFGRVVKGGDRERLCAFFRKHGKEIPTAVLSELFSLTLPSVWALRRESGSVLNAMESHRLNDDWLELEAVPCYPSLTDGGNSRLAQIHQRMRRARESNDAPLFSSSGGRVTVGERRTVAP
ncbi:MAG: hypothetical protein U0136_04790 [Bdellovibrionota bacterium]